MAKPFFFPIKTVLSGIASKSNEILPLLIKRKTRRQCEALRAPGGHNRLSCATKVEETDWRSIIALYDVLLKIKPSPIVALNRAVAVGMVDGPAGLEAVDTIEGLSNYHLRSSVRGDLLIKLGRNAEAGEELQRAIALTDNQREKQLLTEKLNQIQHFA